MTSILRSRQITIFLLLLLFSGIAIARWNRQYYFSPDSARYVIMARSLVNGEGYREIDKPGEPLYAHRPPGLPVLLMPAAWIAPYDAIFAKATVLLTSLAMLALMYFYLQRLNQTDNLNDQTRNSRLDWVALVLTLLLALNPYILFFSTLIMSEIPFTACTLAILYLLSLRPEQPRKWELALFTILLVLLPFLRTIGFAMILAVGCWAVVRKTRWPWLVGVTCSIVTSGLWMVRNAALGKSGYASIALNEIKTQGIVGTLFRMWERTSSHFDSFSQHLFPGLPGVAPSYSGVILDEIFYLPGPIWIYYLLTVVVIGLSCFGMLHRRQRGGTVALGYLVFSLSILSLWPWMQDRFTLPMLPIVLAYLPSGCQAMKGHIQVARPVTAKILSAGLMIVLVLFGGSLVKADYQLINANLQMIFQPQQFYANQLPYSGFSNWTRAGSWLKQNSEPSERIITRQAAIDTTAHRYQTFAFFEIIDPKKLHQMIQKFSAHYLATYDRRIVSAFPWYLMDQDLVYRYNPVYDEQGVMILEIEPNRSGTIRQKYWKEGESLETARQAFEKFPYRTAFQTALAQELFKNDHYEELIDFILELQQTRAKDVKLTSLLGWCYFKTEQYSKAIYEFQQALGMPGQKLLRDDMIRGIELSQKRLAKRQTQDQEEAPASTGKSKLRSAKLWWNHSRIRKTEGILKQALESDSLSDEYRAEMQTLLARVYLVEGRRSEAIQQLNLAIQANNDEAQNLLKMLKREEKVEKFLKKTDVDKTTQTQSTLIPDITQLAKDYEEFGVPGKALALMEQAHTSFPKEIEILRLLLKYQLLYTLTTDAEDTFTQLKTLDPENPDLSQAADQIEFQKQKPRF